MKNFIKSYGNFSQAWKISENVIEVNCWVGFVENFWKFVEKFSGISVITLLIFLENLVIFCWSGGARGECKKMLEIFGIFYKQLFGKI